ncbi:hypothetical protein ACROYT_G033331 [Oculina patagonica]
MQIAFRAKSLLVLRRFGDAIQVCREALELHLEDSGDINLPLCRTSDEWTRSACSFAVIGIQAYAERNQCLKAVKFANQVFKDIEKFPAEVLELCICLLLKESMFDEASDLAEKWLNYEKNFSLELKYLEIAQCYVKHVLFPQGLFEKIQQFLETNQVITPEQRQVLLNFSRPLRKEKMESCTSSVANTSNEVQISSRLRHGTVHGVVMRVTAVLQKLHSLCITVTCHQKTKTLIRIVILFFFIYSLLTASGYKGVNKNSGIFILWQAMLNAWRALLSPYHLIQD